jgi:hypothetical protein
LRVFDRSTVSLHLSGHCRINQPIAGSFFRLRRVKLLQNRTSFRLFEKTEYLDGG